MKEDCSTWVSLYRDRETNIVESVTTISPEEFREQLERMNPRIDFGETGGKDPDLEDVLREAERFGFRRNPYHSLILKTAFEEIQSKRQDG